MSHTLQRKRRARSRRGGRRAGGKLVLALMVVASTIGLGALGAVGYVLGIAESAPSLETLKAVDPGRTSEVFAADGSRLGFIQANEIREVVPGDTIPQRLKDATVAIEDERFYRHNGVDYQGVFRAAVRNARAGSTREGGSTITQQLVRTLYISREQTLQRKIREAKLAEELEQKRSKRWILNTYLNSVPYGTAGGQSAIGVQAASRIYFDKPVTKLRLHEAALLAGLPQAPTSYSPIREPGNAKRRRDEVLSKMAELDLITPQTAERAKRRSLGVTDQSDYYQKRREGFFFDYVKDLLVKKYGARTVKQGGLEVTTSIDLDKQQQARAAIAKSINQPGMPSSAIVTINPDNGYIEAMASSADYGDSKFNLAAQGTRQPGSTFKVMGLVAAVDAGVDPSKTRYVSKPIKLNDPKYGPVEVKTYDGSYRGSIPLDKATLSSDNAVYIQLALDLGPDKVRDAAKKMGITSKLNAYPSEVLGGLEDGVSPLEMARAYTTIASGGLRYRPIAVTKVKFPDGKTQRPFKVKRKRVFDRKDMAVVTDILEQNVERGTGRDRAKISCPAAGKTGTTDKFKDAWFVGYTPDLVTSTWVGYPKGGKLMDNVPGWGNVPGGSMPAQIWHDYMTNAIGSDCARFPRVDKPQFRPFFGKYARTGRSSSDRGDGEDAYREGDGVGQAGNDAGDGGGGNGGFDADLYESPPQDPGN